MGVQDTVKANADMDFHSRVEELLAHAQRLVAAAKRLQEAIDVEGPETVDRTDDDRFNPSDADNEQSQPVVATPTHGDALAPDYVEQPIMIDDEVDRSDKVKDAYNEVQAAKDDINTLVDDIDILSLLDSVSLDDPMSQ